MPVGAADCEAGDAGGGGEGVDLSYFYSYSSRSSALLSLSVSQDCGICFSFTSVRSRAVLLPVLGWPEGHLMLQSPQVQ